MKISSMYPFFIKILFLKKIFKETHEYIYIVSKVSSFSEWPEEAFLQTASGV